MSVSEVIKEVTELVKRHYAALARDVGAGLVSLTLTLLAAGILLLSTPLLVAAACCLALTAILAVIPAPEIHVSLHVEPTQCKVGDVITLYVHVYSIRGAGLAVLNLRLPDAFQIVEGSTVILLFKGFGNLERTIRIQIRTIKSGKYKIPRLLTETYHIAGLGSPKRYYVGNEVEVEVRPRILKIKRLSRTRLAATGIINIAIARSRLLGSQSTDFKEIRKYMPGDPLKHINWKATARHGQDTPLVNEYERETIRRIIIMPDLGTLTSFHCRSLWARDFVYTIVLSLVYSLRARGYIVYIADLLNNKIFRISAKTKALIDLWRKIHTQQNIDEMTILHRGVKLLENILSKVRGGLTIVIVITYVCDLTYPILRSIEETIKKRRDVILLIIDLDIEDYVKKLDIPYRDLVYASYKLLKESYRELIKRGNVVILKADISKSPTTLLRKVLSIV